jgi:uncharacterized protein (UPF0371 family)
MSGGLRDIGFDNDRYIRLQSERIRERIDQFGGKLYLEFGGKIFDDTHASRVLPGFRPDSKLTMLTELKDQAEIIITINAGDIEKNKFRGDLGITYDMEVLRLIDAFRDKGMYVGSVVLTQYNTQAAADVFYTRLVSLGVKVYRHYPISGYPSNIPLIVSEEGYGRNEYVETSRSLVVVTAPGPGSGKMATCLSQLYHENRRGVKAGYAKFETFPVWNLPLRHPVNISYEAATADLNDVNMIDPFHLEAYGVTTINYNRDVEAFPVLNAILERVSGSSPYRSPTDMGVNMAGSCIVDDDTVRAAASREIVRRYYRVLCERRKGQADDASVFKLEMLMNQAGLSSDSRPTVAAALAKSAETGVHSMAMEMNDRTILTGKASPLLSAPSALLLNALKHLAGIPDDITLISPLIIGPVQELKVDYLGNVNPRLHSDEVLVALSICATNDDIAKKAFEQLPGLKGCEVHSSVMLSAVDEDVYRKLGVNLTCEPRYQTNCLYHGQRMI